MFSLNNSKKIINNFVWETELSSLPFWQVFFIRFLRIIYAVLVDLTQGQLPLQAMGLVYTTLLSFVPLLAVSFSVLKGFGVHNQIEPLLLNFLAPLGDKNVEITNIIIGFVENIDVGVLGTLGLGFLVFTIVSLIYKIEKVFNLIWHIKTPRTFAQRFSDYLSVILIGPVLIFSALGATASVVTAVNGFITIEYIDLLFSSTVKLIPYLFIIGAFTFVYIFVPNTKVRFGSALVGAVVAGILWQTIGWGFAIFIVSSATKYAAIYSSFAILIIFLIWLYLAWLVLLIGSSISFYYQYPQNLNIRKHELCLSNELKEKIALLSMYAIGKSYFFGNKLWTEKSLAQHLNIPTDLLINVLITLEKKSLIIKIRNEIPCYIPARSIEMIQVKEIWESIRTDFQYFNMQRLPSENNVNLLVNEINNSVEQVLKDLSLKDLVLNDTNLLPTKKL